MSEVTTSPRVLLEVRSSDDLHNLLRRRAEEIDVSRLLLDQLAGLSAGFSSHVLADEGRCRLTIDNAALLVPAMGLKLIVVEDPADVARMQRRWTSRGGAANTAPIAASPWERAGELRREQCRRAGKARARSMSKPERTELARRGGEARAEALTDWRRKQIARDAAISRWSRRMPASDQASIAA